MTETSSDQEAAETDTASRRLLAASRRARRPARVATAIAVASGLLNLFSAMLPADTGRLHDLQPYVPGQISSNVTAVVAAAGFAMLLLANGLHRRSRHAWALLVALLLVSATGHVLKGLDIEEAIVQTFLAGYLVGTSEHFTATPDRRRSLRTRAFELVSVLAVAYAFGLLTLLAGSAAGITESAAAAMRLMVGIGPSFPAPDRTKDVAMAAVLALEIFGVLAVLYRTVAPVPAPHGVPATPDEALASDDSLAWFATREDKITVRAGGSAVAFGLFGNVALASGDPLGPSGRWGDAIEEFVTEALLAGRYVGVVGCGHRAASEYRKRGLRGMYMGDEAVLDLSTFTLTGGAMKTVRNSHTRAVKAGYSARALRIAELEPSLVDQLRMISDSWRGGDEERGFSMSLGRLFEPEDSAAYVVIAFDADGTPRGFLHMVPWGTTGASLDVMRRDRDAIAVLNDFLVAESARLLPELGVERVSLNFSALRGVLVAGAERDATLLLRLQRRLLLRMSSSFQIETLYRFNKKFQPKWVPRYLMLGAIEDAPAVLYAALKAEGLLPRLHVRRRAVDEHE